MPRLLQCVLLHSVHDGTAIPVGFVYVQLPLLLAVVVVMRRVLQVY